jgi:hypothetical protein
MNVNSTNPQFFTPSSVRDGDPNESTRGQTQSSTSRGAVQGERRNFQGVSPRNSPRQSGSGRNVLSRLLDNPTTDADVDNFLDGNATFSEVSPSQNGTIDNIVENWDDFDFPDDGSDNSEEQKPASPKPSSFQLGLLALAGQNSRFSDNESDGSEEQKSESPASQPGSQQGEMDRQSMREPSQEPSQEPSPEPSPELSPRESFDDSEDKAYFPKS